MDTSGYLRQIMDEDLMTMEDIVDPVQTVNDIPDLKLDMFKLIDQ